MKDFSKILIFSFLGVVFISCFNDPECLRFRNDIIDIVFKEKATGNANQVTIMGITIQGSDSTFNKNQTTDKVSLPLNFSEKQQSITFVLALQNSPDSVTHTLDLQYIVRTQFESVDCGPRFIFSDLTWIKSSFDSVSVINTFPQEENTSRQYVNIEVYP